MAGKKIGFITGGNAILRVNGRKMAFLQDVNYNSSVDTIPVEACGKYSVIANEPIAYSISGSFTITRYVVNSSTKTGIPNISADGSNSPGIWSNSQLNPGKMINSATFDIEIYQKEPFFGGNTETATNEDVVSTSVFNTVVTITDCRITRRTGSVNKRGIFTETFNFIGILFKDDQGDDTGSVSGLTGTNIV